MRNYREASRYEDLVCAFLKTQIKTLVSVRQREKKDHGMDDLGCYLRWYVCKRVLGLFCFVFGGGGGVWGVGGGGGHIAPIWNSWLSFWKKRLKFPMGKRLNFSIGKHFNFPMGRCPIRTRKYIHHQLYLKRIC